MALTNRENYLRNARMQGPEWMPCAVHISGASWYQLREDLEDVCARHPVLFPGFEKGRIDFDNMAFGGAYRAGERYRDNWGCVWQTTLDGIEGVVVESPLADWDALGSWAPPDALTTLDRGPADWDGVRRHIAAAEERGDLTVGGTAHGFLVMRLYYLRGFENLMVDIASREARLHDLIARVMAHNETIVDQYLSMGVDLMGFAEDLGTQTSSMVSPAQFREWFTPEYERLMRRCHEAGALVSLHSDGHVLELMDELIRAGVDIINPQDLCNGIDNLVREVKGRMAICLDVDRQSIVPFGTREGIHDLIEEEVRKLGSPEGGLELICGIYPPTPPENVDALCSAMEDHRTYWWDGRAGKPGAATSLSHGGGIRVAPEEYLQRG